jgi:serine/threonine protein kinase
MEDSYPGGTEVIVKSFAWSGEFEGAFQEIAGGICTTQLVNTGTCENFVRVYDVFIAKDTLFMLFERMVGDIEKEFNSEEHDESLEDPFTMWNVLFQLGMAMRHMQETCELVHFDVRHDNVQVQWLDQPRKLYEELPYETNFVIKLIDFGQCELKIGETRPMNEDVVHGEESIEHWGRFPEEFCPGYDMQYFCYTLVDILQGFLAQYYVLDALLKTVDDSIGTESNKTPQSRPKVVSQKTAREIVEFLKGYKDMV